MAPGGGGIEVLMLDRKSFSLDAWRQKVCDAWCKLSDGLGFAWLNEVFDDYVIVSKGQQHWRVGYSLGEADVIFAPMNEWLNVEQTWQPTGEPVERYAIKQLDDDGRIGAYAIRFGSADEPDISDAKDFFTPETEFWLSELGFAAGKASAPMLYAHGADATTAHEPVVGCWTKAVVDEFGVWLEGQLDRARKYTGWVEYLVKKGLLKVSSDSASHLIQREPQANGTHKMIRWPLLAASLTMTPAEPRLLPVEMLGLAYKSVGLGVSEFEKKLFALEVMTMDPKLIEQIAVAVAAKVALPSESKAEVKEEAKAFDLDGLVEAVSDGVMAKLAAQPAIKDAGFLVKPKSEGPFVNRLPHNMDSVKAFNLMLHVGEHRLSDAVKSLLVWNDGRGNDVSDGMKTAMNVGTAGQGGYLVPVEYSMEFIQSLAELSHLRAARASQIMFPDSLSFHIPSLTFGAAAALTSEAAAYNEVEPTLADTTFTAYKFTRLSKASDELVDDSRFDLWQEVLSPDWVQAFAAAENTYMTTGSGSSQPQGVVTGAGTGKTAASATAITADEIKDLFYSLNHRYRDRPTAAFMLNDAILQYVDKLKDGEGRYLLSGDLSRGMPLQLMGKPIIINNSMASTVATGNKTILFGDFSYFKIADRSSKADGKLAGTEIYVRRLNELYAETGQVGFRAFMRFDSHVMLAAAFKLLVQA